MPRTAQSMHDSGWGVPLESVQLSVVRGAQLSAAIDIERIEGVGGCVLRVAAHRVPALQALAG